jgi:glycosyltransferase involved in cell wall biosynthesis
LKGTAALRKELRIVHVVRSPVGGVFRHITDLVWAQSQAGHAVGLVCDATSAGPLEEARIAELGPSLALGVRRIGMTRAIGPADMLATFGVTRALGAMSPDIVHSHGAKGGVYGRLAAAFERRDGRAVAAFYAPHGGSLHYDPGSLSGIIYFRVERALERLTDGLIHVSDYEAKIYREKVGEPHCPAHVVRNGLRPEDFEPIKCERNGPDFLFIGELRELKGVDIFIEALALLEKEGRAPRAVIVGPATDESQRRYREQANAEVKKNRVAFLPPMPAREAFCRARTVVVPSRAESLPYVVLEAAAAGRPLIATRVGGIPEIFNGEGERLVQPGSVEALAAAMRTALEEPQAMTVEAMLRRDKVAQKFSLAASSRRIDDIYRAALEARYRVVRAGAVAEVDLPR